MDIDDLKQYLRIDSDYDDVLIDSLLIAAEEYLSNNGITKNYEKQLYKLAVKLLVSHWYENREVLGKGDNLKFSLNAILMQLKYGE